MKVVPFARNFQGNWQGQFGRQKVEIRHATLGPYWRGPNSEVVLNRTREIYGFTLVGVFSGSAHTLAGAIEAAEIACRRELQQPAGPLLFPMTDEQRALEAAAERKSQLDAIEADRIAHENGWEMAMDKLPELKAFAESEGLYPFDATPSQGMR